MKQHELDKMLEDSQESCTPYAKLAEILSWEVTQISLKVNDFIDKVTKSEKPVKDFEEEAFEICSMCHWGCNDCLRIKN